jgi:hypothetical protein
MLTFYPSPTRLPPPPKSPRVAPSSPTLLLVRSRSPRAPRHCEIEAECHRQLHLPGECRPSLFLPPICASHLLAPSPDSCCRSSPWMSSATGAHPTSTSATVRRRLHPHHHATQGVSPPSYHRAQRLPGALPVLTG